MPVQARPVPVVAAAVRRARRIRRLYWIEMSVQPDGTFTVSNSRNGFSKTGRKAPVIVIFRLKAEATLLTL